MLGWFVAVVVAGRWRRRGSTLAVVVLANLEGLIMVDLARDLADLISPAG